MLLMAPCKDCAERWLDIEHEDRCHNHCSRYKEFVIAKKIETANIRKQTTIPMYQTDANLGRAIKTTRKKKEKRCLFDR
jgi:hypothetical protein